MRHYFGKIIDEKMMLSEAGAKADRDINDIPKHFVDTKNINHIVMPNHLHLLLQIGEPLVGTWETGTASKKYSQLANVIGGLKSSVTKYCNSQRIPFAWHRSFYDHIVTTHAEFENIMSYINSNIINWITDKYYSE